MSLLSDYEQNTAWKYEPFFLWGAGSGIRRDYL